MHSISDELYDVMTKASAIAYCVACARVIPSQQDLDAFAEADRKWKASMKPAADTLPNRCREEGV